MVADFSVWGMFMTADLPQVASTLAHGGSFQLGRLWNGCVILTRQGSVSLQSRSHAPLLSMGP